MSCHEQDLQSTDRVILETRKLSRTIGGVNLVDQVSIRIQAQEVVAVVGPSGSGKSSLLSPTSGSKTAFFGLRTDSSVSSEARICRFEQSGLQ